MSRFSDCLLFLPVYVCFFTIACLHTILVTIHRIHLGRLLNVQEDLCAISCNQNTLCLECELHPEIRSFLPNGCVMPHRVVDRGFFSHIYKDEEQKFMYRID